MAKPAKPAERIEVEDAADAPKSNKKLIIIGAVVVLAIAGAGGWYFTQGSSAGHGDAKTEVRNEPIFIPLETFTVNLQHEENERFLQVNLTLKVFELLLEEKIRTRLPEIRSKLNLLLSSKRPSELATAEGKTKLAAEIVFAVNNVLGIRTNPAVRAAAPATAPVAESAVAAEHPADAEVARASEVAPAEGVAAGETPAAPVAEAPAHAASGATESRGVVDVLFTSFIIQ